MDTSNRILKALLTGGIALFLFLTISSPLIDAPIFGDNAAYAFDYNGTKISGTDIYHSMFTDDTYWPKRAMVIDGNDNKHIVWTDYRDLNWEIYYSRIDDSGNVIIDSRRVTNNVYQSLMPSVAVDPAGNAHIVWHDNRNINWEIYYEKIAADPAVTVPLADDIRVTTNNADQAWASIDTDSTGNVYIVWHDVRNGNSNADIYFKKLSANVPVQILVDETQIIGTGNNQYFPSIAVLPDGTAHLTWQDYRNGNWDVYYQKLDSDGNKLLASDLLLTAAGVQGGPSIAVDPTGNAHIAWVHGSTSQDIYYQKIDPSGTALLATPRLVTDALNTQSVPIVSVDSAGNAHIVYQSNQDGNWNIYYEKISADHTAIPSLIDENRVTDNPYVQTVAYAAVDSSDTVHITWTDWRDGHKEIYYCEGVDTTAPSNMTVNINNDAVYTTSTTVHIFYSAEDAESGLEYVGIANAGGSYNWYLISSYPSMHWLGLTTGDGTKEVLVIFKDRAGNYSAPVSDEIILDIIKPTISNFTILGTGSGNYATNTREVTLQLIASDATSGVAEMQFRNYSQEPWSAFESYSETKSGWMLYDEDGQREMRAQVRDNAGLDAASVAIDYIVLDRVNPYNVNCTTNSTYNDATWQNINGNARDASSGIWKVEIQLVRDSDGKYWTGTTWEAGEQWLTASPNGVVFNEGGTANKPWIYVISPSNFQSGETYWVYTKAFDHAGNTTDAATVSFGYANDAPISNVLLDRTAYGPTTWSIDAANASIKGDAFAGPGAEISKVWIMIERNDGYIWWLGHNAFRHPVYGEYWIDLSASSISDIAGIVDVGDSYEWYFIGIPAYKLANGSTYTIHSSAADNVSPNPNVQDSADEAIFSYDTTPPNASFSYPGNGDELNGTLTFEGVATDANGISWRILVGADLASAQEIIAGASQVNGQFPNSYNSNQLTDGTYNFYLEVEDSAGNPSVIVPTITNVIIDNTDPLTDVADISGAQADASTGWYTGPVTITLNTSDAPSGIAQTYYNIMPGDINGTGTTVVVNGAVDGEYTVTYYSVDEAGNVEDPHTELVKIDKTNPVAPVIEQPFGGADTTTNVLLHTLSGTCPEDAVEIIIEENGVEIDTIIPVSGTWSKAISLDPLQQGDYAYTVIAVDESGRTNDPNLSAEMTITLDSNGPTAPIVTQMVSPTNSLIQTISGYKDNDVVRIEVNGSETGVLLTSLTSWSYEVDLTGKSDGTHTFEIVGFDDQNNASLTTTIQIVLDTQAPPSPPTVTSVVPAVTNSTTLSLQGNYYGDTHKVIIARYLESDPQGEFEVDLSGGTWTYDVPLDIGEGNYTLKIRAEDLAENATADTVKTVRVDIYPPAGALINIESGAEFTNSATVTLNPFAEAGTGGTPVTEMCFSNNGSTWSMWEPYSTLKNNWPLDAATDGEKTVYVKFRDQALNESVAVSDTITLDTTAPEISEVKINDQSITNPVPNPGIDPKVITPTPQVDVTAEDPEAGDLSRSDIAEYVAEFVSEDGSGTTTTVNNNTSMLEVLDGQALEAGIYTLNIKVTDAAGNTGMLVIEGIEVTGGDPKVTSKVVAFPSPFNPLSGGEMKISFTISGDNDSLVGLYIHDTAGRLVWKEVRPAQQLFTDKGFTWDGYTQFNREITENGVYLIRVVDETNKKLIGKTKVLIIKRK